jgi:hypothetical protein
MMVRIMSEPQRRVSEAAKKTVKVAVRLTRLEGELLERLVATHDPPTVAAWLRHVLAGEFDKPLPRPK